MKRIQVKPVSVELVEKPEAFQETLEQVLGEAVYKLTQDQRDLLLTLFAQASIGGGLDFKKACAEVGCSHATLNSLQAKPIWDGLMRWIGRKALNAMSSRIVPIAKKMAKQAESGKAQQQKMIFQALGLLSDENSGGVSQSAPVKVIKRFVIKEEGGILKATAEIQTEELVPQGTPIGPNG